MTYATSDDAQARDNIDSTVDQARQRIYALMWNYTDYMRIGNAQWVGSLSWTIADSFESIHGWPHVALGGNYGHMTYQPWSAFDPAFWLHHW